MIKNCYYVSSRLMSKAKTIMFLSMLCFFAQGYAQDRCLKIVVSNIHDIQGKIYISVFNDKKHFLDQGYELKIVEVDVDGPEVVCEIDDLCNGEYAIALYQDTNSDGKCGRNILGIPTEPYGFSNNIRPRFRAPTYDETKISTDYDEIRISLIH